MPRKGPVGVRVPEPDIVYGSRLVSRLINVIMKRGKKSTAERIVYGALAQIGERANKDPLEVYEQALKAVMPEVEVRPRRVGAPPIRCRWKCDRRACSPWGCAGWLPAPAPGGDGR